MPDFRESTDRLIQPPPSFQLRELADACDVSLNTINRARMESGQKRSPPTNWQSIIARIARDHAADLDAKAADLRALASELDPPA